jgi:hypothetical protein
MRAIKLGDKLFPWNHSCQRCGRAGSKSMALFKLKATEGDISQAELVEASHTSLNLEQHLECWLEKSPWAIAEEPLLVIGRQPSAAVESGTIFPDLLAIDKDGRVVVVELKKGKALRDVVAQLLEYAAWASELTQQSIEDLAAPYLGQHGVPSLDEAFCKTFEADDLPVLNQGQRLFIAAEEISPAVARVCRFLRTSHGVDVNCVEFSVFQTEAGEILVTSDWIVGREEIGPTKSPTRHQWSGEKPVKQVVWEAVQELTGGDKNYIFSPKEVAQVVLSHYHDFNKSTVGCQIISDCVNHTSRHHYPGGEDRYWWVEKGKYRLFDPNEDQVTG